MPARLPTEPQYQSYHLLLSEVSAFTARLTHNAYRPRLRPAGAPQLLPRLLYGSPGLLGGLPAACFLCLLFDTPSLPPHLNSVSALLSPAAGEAARIWWRYAAKAVQQQVAARKLTWGQAIRVSGSSSDWLPAGWI